MVQFSKDLSKNRNSVWQALFKYCIVLVQARLALIIVSVSEIHRLNTVNEPRSTLHHGAGSFLPQWKYVLISPSLPYSVR